MNSEICNFKKVIYRLEKILTSLLTQILYIFILPVIYLLGVALCKKIVRGGRVFTPSEFHLGFDAFFSSVALCIASYVELLANHTRKSELIGTMIGNKKAVRDVESMRNVLSNEVSRLWGLPSQDFQNQLTQYFVLLGVSLFILLYILHFHQQITSETWKTAFISSISGFLFWVFVAFFVIF